MIFHMNLSKFILFKLIPGCLLFIFFTGITIGSVKAGDVKPGTSSESSKGSQKSAKGSNKYVAIDFNDVDIAVFIKFISELTGKNFVIDHRVKGKVTILSPGKISLAEAYKVFESVLEVHGYATVQAGQVIKIVPAKDARTKSIETRLRAESGSAEDKVITQLIPLKYADPAEIKRLFTPLISKSSIILAYPSTNILIITDIASNLVRLTRILKAIDIPGVGREISVIPVEFSDAGKLVSLLNTVFKTKIKVRKGTSSKPITFVADERTNTIVVIASEEEIIRIKKLIKMLDKKTPRGEEKIRVYYLENATAEDLAKVLQEIPQKQSSTVRGKKLAPVLSSKIRITADKATNSLIIMADKEDYQVLEEIIRKIDIPRSMVYIEALIMEVNVNKNFRIGAEWVAGHEASYDGRDGGIGGGFGGGALGGDPGYTSTPNYDPNTNMNFPVPLPPGFALGVFGEALNIGGIPFPSISAVIQAYQKDKDVNILSTPQILTTNNEEAKITVGKNIPFQTKSTTTNNDTFSSFEYKDVGKTLKITPQISKDRMVRLKLSLEVTALESTTDFRPTTLKRTIETTVIVKDKNTVVIGGLIDDDISRVEYKVPCLGDIPLLGWLFRSRSTGKDKTNLFIFLTPRVIKSPFEADTLLHDKKDQIESIREGQIKFYPEEQPLLNLEKPDLLPEQDETEAGNPLGKIKPDFSGGPKQSSQPEQSTQPDRSSQPDKSTLHNQPDLNAKSPEVLTLPEAPTSASAPAARPDEKSAQSPEIKPRQIQESDLAADPRTLNSKKPAANDLNLIKNYTLQVASSQHLEIAEQIKNRLKAKGHAAYIITGRVKGQIWHRVRIGYFQYSAQARDKLIQLKQDNIKGFLIKL